MSPEEPGDNDMVHETKRSDPRLLRNESFNINAYPLHGDYISEYRHVPTSTDDN